MEIIYEVIRKANINMDRKTFYDTIENLLEKHNWIYENVPIRTEDELKKIWEELEPYNFGRIMLFLAMIYKLKLSKEETERETLRVIEPLKTIDIERYKIETIPSESFVRKIVKRIL